VCAEKVLQEITRKIVRGLSPLLASWGVPKAQEAVEKLHRVRAEGHYSGN
jgi:hypothetical protein